MDTPWIGRQVENPQHGRSDRLSQTATTDNYYGFSDNNKLLSPERSQREIQVAADLHTRKAIPPGTLRYDKLFGTRFGRVNSKSFQHPIFRDFWRDFLGDLSQECFVARVGFE